MSGGTRPGLIAARLAFRCLQTDTQGNRSGVTPLPFMDTGMLEHRLALVERQIVDAEQHVTLRRDNLIHLELDGLSASPTAGIARDRLRQIEDNLRRHGSERKQLQAELRRIRAA
jgi:hypothetical protein